MNGAKLRGVMAERGCTQKMLAAGIGKSENSLSSKINGRIPFNTDEILAICVFLHIESNTDKALIFLTESSQ